MRNLVILFLPLLAVAIGTAVYFGLTAPISAPQLRTFETSAGVVAIEQVAEGFQNPWAVTFLPNGAMLVTERRGRLWRLDQDGGRTEVTGVPIVLAEGQGGLHDVVAARDFAETHEIFLTFAEPNGDASRTAVAIARLADNGEHLENVQTIFRQQPSTGATIHYGSRIVEALDGTLWVALGERRLSSQAQSPVSTIGKVVRINRDGSAPRDNPFVGALALDEIWSFGHRNPQGAALDPATGALWTVEHGAKGGDEINKPEAGKNYGWPVISYGTTYAGTQIGIGTEKEGMEQPIFYWDPSIAPSGMMIYSGKLWPDWQGDIFVGALKFKLISRLDREGDSITGEERLFEGVYGRVRDVREGPKGAIWFLTDADLGGLFRITPVE